MFSDIEQVNQLTSLLMAYGVRHAVVCPGSRNAPIVHNLAECGVITCHSVTDERSAGFYAIGISEQTSQPVVVCVTSGSALLNVAPAVAEAYYRHIPLIVVSADRPMQWIDQNDGQTLRQSSALAAVVRRHVNLPMPTDDETRWYCNRLICEALIDCASWRSRCISMFLLANPYSVSLRLPCHAVVSFSITPLTPQILLGTFLPSVFVVPDVR